MESAKRGGSWPDKRVNEFLDQISEGGEDYRRLRSFLPQLTVLAGCCGTDTRHVERICAACLPEAAAA